MIIVIEKNYENNINKYSGTSDINDICNGKRDEDDRNDSNTIGSNISFLVLRKLFASILQ